MITGKSGLLSWFLSPSLTTTPWNRWGREVLSSHYFLLSLFSPDPSLSRYRQFVRIGLDAPIDRPHAINCKLRRTQISRGSNCRWYASRNSFGYINKSREYKNLRKRIGTSFFRAFFYRQNWNGRSHLYTNCWKSSLVYQQFYIIIHIYLYICGCVLSYMWNYSKKEGLWIINYILRCFDWVKYFEIGSVE